MSHADSVPLPLPGSGRCEETCSLARLAATKCSVRTSRSTDDRTLTWPNAYADVAFDGTAWSSGGPPILVFDEQFVDSNVHSGLSIEAGHRQNLHALVIGEEGVALQKRVEELGAEIAALQVTVREKQTAISM